MQLADHVRAFAPGLAGFVLLQIGWFSCVLGAAAGAFALGPVVVAALIALHLGWSSERRRDLELIAALGLAGTVLDSAQAWLGLLDFRGAPEAWLAPPWIIALWLHFGTTRGSLLELVRGRPWSAAAMGAVAGPVAYGAGVRLGAASFHPRPLWSILSIALVWGMVLPAASRFAWRDA